MKTFNKEYIGKGKEINGLQIVKVTLKVDDLQKFIYEKDGINYLTFELAKMKQPDAYGRTHTAYCVSFYEENGIEMNTDELVEKSLQAGTISKSGSWFSFKDRKIGHGKQEVLDNLKKDKKLRREILMSLPIPF